MATAGHIAEGLGIEDVTINYQTAQILSSDFYENPMRLLEYARYNYDYKEMYRKTKDRYKDMFPEGLDFQEAGGWWGDYFK